MNLSNIARSTALLFFIGCAHSAPGPAGVEAEILNLERLRGEAQLRGVGGRFRTSTHRTSPKSRGMAVFAPGPRTPKQCVPVYSRSQRLTTPTSTSTRTEMSPS